MFSVGSYLAYQGDQFVERFDANSYVTLTTAMDLFDLGEGTDAIRESLSKSRCAYLFLSFTSDWLYPVAASQQLVDALNGAGGATDGLLIPQPRISGPQRRHARQRLLRARWAQRIQSLGPFVRRVFRESVRQSRNGDGREHRGR